MINPKELYTHSRIAAHRACPRLEYYAYALGYREINPALALRFGTCFHDGCKAYWMYRAKHPKSTLEERVDVALRGIRDRPMQDEYEHGKLEAMITAYVVVWEHSNVEVMHVELPFRVPLRNPDTHDEHPNAELGGQMDLVLRWVDTGHVSVTEHKTSARDVSNDGQYVVRLKIDGQIGIYFHGATILGLDAHDVIYDVAKKPLLRPKNNKKDGVESAASYARRVQDEFAAHTDQYIQRIRIGRPDSEQQEVWRDIWSWVVKMEQAAQEQDYPRNPDACFRYGSECQYFKVCSGRVAIDDPVFFIKKGKHVELIGEESRTMTIDDALGF